MTDYKDLHQRLVREDHDFRAGWRREQRDGLWFFFGLAIGLGVCVILVVA